MELVLSSFEVTYEEGFNWTFATVSATLGKGDSDTFSATPDTRDADTTTDELEFCEEFDSAVFLFVFLRFPQYEYKLPFLFRDLLFHSKILSLAIYSNSGLLLISLQ